MNLFKRYGKQFAAGLVILGALLVLLSFSLFSQPVVAQVWLHGSEEPFITYVDSPYVVNWLGRAGIRVYPNDSVRLSGVQIPHDFAMLGEGNRQVFYKPAVPIDLIMDGEVYSFYSGADTLAEALWEQGIILKQADRVTPGLQTVLDRPLDVTLRRAQPLTIITQGDEIQVLSAAKTVGAALAESGFALQGLDFSRPSAQSPIPNDRTIQVVRVREQILTEDAAIPYSTERVSDPEMDVGQEQVLQAGVDGTRTSVILVRYENGEEVQRDVISEDITQAPVIERIAYGGNIVEQSIGDLEYYYSLNARVTCYGWTGNTTSSGVYPSYGTIAVKLPWYSILKGTQIYVPNYGTGTVQDVCPGCTGEPWIDVYTDECYTNPFTYDTTIYFLSPAPPAFSGELP